MAISSAHPLAEGTQFKVHLAKKVTITENKTYEVMSPFSRLIWQRYKNATYKINSTIYDVGPNDLFLLPANTPMACFARRDMHQWFCYFRTSTALRTPLFELVSPQTHHITEQNHDLRTTEMLFTSLIQAYNLPSPQGIVLSQGSLSVLTALFLPDSMPQIGENELSERLGPALRFIHEHFADQISLVALAELVGYSTNYFSHVFSQHMGLSPQAYIVRQRIQRAKELLVSTDESLLSIAHQSGYSDAFSLSRQFKRSTGLSPKYYRQQALSEPAID